MEAARTALTDDAYKAALDRETMAYYRQVEAIEATTRARQAANQQRINSLLGVKDDFKTEARAADIAAYGAELDRLRERYVPLVAAAGAYERALQEINRAAQAGAFKDDSERVAAIDRATQAYMRQKVAIEATARAAKSFSEERLSGLGAASADFSGSMRANERANSMMSGLGASVSRADAAALDEIRRKYDQLYDAAENYRQKLAQIEKDKWGLSDGQYRAAVDEATAAYERQVSAIKAVQSASDTALQASIEKFNPLIRAANDYKRDLEEIEAVQKAGGFKTDADYTSTVDRRTASYDRQVKAIKQMEQAGKSIRLTTFELTNLSYQANDAATMLLSGSSAFQVFATQGSQVYQILAGSEGGLVGGLKDTGKALTSLLSPARLAGGAIVGAAALAVTSYASWIAAEKQLQLALEGRGRATKATTADLMAIAGAAADAGNVTVSEARDIAAALASTGKIGTDLYGALIDATRNFATVTQQELPAAAKEIADAFADPAKGAEKLNDKLAFLDTATLTYIKDLAASNRGHEAANLLLQKLNGVLPDASQNLTALGRAWKGVANFASNAYDAMGRGIGRLLEGPGLEEEIAGIEARLKELNSAAGKSGRYGQYDQSRERVELEQRLTELSDKRSKMEARSADAAKKAAEDTARSIAGARDPRIKQLEDLKTAYQGVTKAITENAGDVEQLTRIREGIVNQIGTIASGDMSKGADTVKLIPATEQLRREQDLLMASVTAYTPAQRAAAAAEQARYDALKRGASSAEASLEAENARAKELAQANVALTTAQRDRLLTGEENVASQQLEIDLIGKTAGEAAELRANYQAYWDLKREALENGTELDKDQLELMKAQNKELGKAAELRAKAGLWADINKERAAIGRSPTEQAIYDRLESAGLKPDLESAEAAALRLNETLSLTKDIATDAFSDLINDLIDGENAMESL